MMPITTFRLVHGQKYLDVNLPAFEAMLPSSMKVVCRDDGQYIEVESLTEEDPGAQFHVDRELDRLFFLTCVRARAEMCKRTASVQVRIAYSIHGPIPPGAKPQSWNYALGVQLRLWSIASEVADPLTKILLYYQIIELSAPSLRPYADSTSPPPPLTECRLLRHLIAHAGDVSSKELKAYCDYLGLPTLMVDRTDSAYVELLSSKCKFVEAQARTVLEGALQPLH